LRSWIVDRGPVPPERTLVVGDSGVDVRTARNAGAWACGVTYGFQPETFAGDPPDFLVDSLEQLATIVTQGAQPHPVYRTS
jgi:phosphoglycolate phosphatase-like HAD superfamily hydrolase